MSDNRVVVFDIGNVLLRWNPRNLYRKTFGGDDIAMEEFLATACSADWLRQLDCGAIADGIAAQAAAFPHYRDQLGFFDTRWLETLDGTIDENVALVSRLQAQGREVYALTNYPRDKFEMSRPLFPFLDRFDGIVVSGREGLAKPDTRIFTLLLERFALHAPETLFIDDAPHNVAAAARVGMDTIHYGPGVDLAEELTTRGLLDPNTR